MLSVPSGPVTLHGTITAVDFRAGGELPEGVYLLSVEIPTGVGDSPAVVRIRSDLVTEGTETQEK